MTKGVVLVVDDEEILREAIGAYFKRSGFDVKTAGNGIEALKVTDEHKVDIVISDVQMPEMGGVDLIKELKKRNPSLPVIVFITAFADLTAEIAYSLGAAAVMPKPFDRKALLAIVEKLAAHNLPHWADQAPEVKRALPLLAISEEDLGVGGAHLDAPITDAHVDEVVSFQIDAGLKTKALLLKGEAVVRWHKAGPKDGFSQVGIEFLHLEEPGRTEFFEWVGAVKPVPFIPKSK